MTTYYTYTIKALDKHDKLALAYAYVNITDEQIFMATLKGNFNGMVENYHYDIVKQDSKISNKGNKVKRWVSQVCQKNGLYRFSKADELALQMGGVRIYE